MLPMGSTSPIQNKKFFGMSVEKPPSDRTQVPQNKKNDAASVLSTFGSGVSEILSWIIIP